MPDPPDRPGQSIRLFVALDIPGAVRQSVGELAAQFKKLWASAKWVNLEGAHVTLKFIGWVAADQLEKIQQALAAVSAPPGAALPAAFDLHFAGLGFFPSPHRPRVFWAGIAGGAELPRLAASIDDALASLGIPKESREFQPHLTLARFPEPPRGPEMARLAAAVAEHAADDFGSARAGCFYLYQSVLKPQAAEYTRLSSYPLRG